jgi:hypothetical protein
VLALCALSLQYLVVDAVATKEGEVVLLAAPRWASDSTASATAAPTTATTSSSARQPSSSTDYKLVRMKASFTSAATDANAAAPDTELEDCEFAPLHVILKRCGMF